jgi:hypothetical protein
MTNVYEFSQDTELNDTITLHEGDILRGMGKKVTLTATQQANPIIVVDGNDVLIENVQIVGQTGPPLTHVGIRLENVSNCQIRNAPIYYCTIGIDMLTSSQDPEVRLPARSNRIHHVYMQQVLTGIRFATTVWGSGDFSFTNITDVNITAYPDPNSKGISILQDACLDNAFIKANAWFGYKTGCSSGSDNACAMHIDGKVKNSFINLTAERLTSDDPDPNNPTQGGFGIILDEHAEVAYASTQAGNYNNEIFIYKMGTLNDHYKNVYSKPFYFKLEG